MWRPCRVRSDEERDVKAVDERSVAAIKLGHGFTVAAANGSGQTGIRFVSGHPPESLKYICRRFMSKLGKVPWGSELLLTEDRTCPLCRQKS